MAEKRMAVLWLRYLTEFDYDNPAIINYPETEEIRKAIDILEESAYTKEELEVYDKYWDTVRVEKALKSDSREQGRKEGFIEGKEEGRIKGLQEKLKNIVKTMDKNGFNDDDIALATGLSIDDIKKIINK